MAKFRKRLKEFLHKNRLIKDRSLEKKRLEELQILESPFFKIEPIEGIAWMADRCCLISKEHQFVYCRFPKAANSTVVATLHKAASNQEENSWRAINHLKEGASRPSHLTELEVENLRNNYFSFAICRNPYDRLISAYLNKVHDVKQYGQRKWILGFLKKGPNATISFDEFLDFIEFGNGNCVDYHWACQADLLAIPSNKLSYIGKVETLEQDLSFITKKIYNKSVDVVNWNPHSTKRQRDSFTLTTNQQHRVSRLFEKDFDLFKYTVR